MRTRRFLTLIACAVLLTQARPADAFIDARQPLSFEDKTQYESHWLDNVEVPFEEMYSHLTSTELVIAEARAPGTAYGDMDQKAKDTYGVTLNFYQGLIPLAQDAVVKLLPKVTDATQKNAIQKQLDACKQYRDIADAWREAIKTKRGINDIKAAGGDLKWPNLGDYAGPILVPMSHPDVGGLQPESAISLMQLMAIGSPDGTIGGIWHPCMIAFVGVMRASGIIAACDNCTFWHPVEIPDSACSRYRFEEPKDPSNAKSCVRVQWTTEAVPAAAGTTNQNAGWIKAAKEYIERLKPKVEEANADAAKRAAEAEAIRRKAKIGSAVSLPLPLGDTSPAQLVGRVIGSILGIVGSIALLMFVYGGIRYMVAAKSGQGDKEVQTAKAIIVWSTMGVIAIFSAYAVVRLVISTLNG
jgi:hypothetical protein